MPELWRSLKRLRRDKRMIKLIFYIFRIAIVPPIRVIAFILTFDRGCLSMGDVFCWHDYRVTNSNYAGEDLKCWKCGYEK